MAVLNEGNYLNDLLKWEMENRQSREKVVVAASQVLAMGAVVGKVKKSVPTAGTPGTNTGGGTMTGVSGGSRTEIGAYRIECVDISDIAPATPAAATPFTHNTGDGVMGAVAVGAGAKVGDYTLEILKEGATAAFLVRYPDGSVVGQGVVGTEFVGGGLSFTLADGAEDFIVGDGFVIAVGAAAGGTGAKWNVTTPSGVLLSGPAVTGTPYESDHLNFTINDSGTNFAVGDSFSVEVAEGSGAVKEIDFDAVDGTQDAFGFLIAGIDTTDGAADGVAIVRDAQIVPDYLAWPAGATSDQKTVALAQLYDKGIVTRDEA